MQQFVDCRPHLGLNIHIDDLCLAATGRSEDEVLQHIAEGTAAMETIIEHELESKVSIPKADLVATSHQLRIRVGKAMEQYGHKAASASAVNWAST